jgi:alpha-beta hydrolase superfamily lysophospholipase
MDIATVTATDGYSLQARVWRPSANACHQVYLLHGIVSHSEWLTPLAEQLAALGIEVLCPDRRGAGLSTEAGGDAPSAAVLVDDLCSVVERFARPNVHAHIGGFCWGATYAINCLEKLPGKFRSFVMVAPSIFPAADIGAAELQTGDSAEATLDPHVPLDRFTSGAAYRDYIIPDKLKTAKVSPRFNAVLLDMNRLLGPRWAKLGLPTLMLLASDDRLSDNSKHERAFETLRAAPKKTLTIAGEHGLQFDAPRETARAIADWLPAAVSDHRVSA